MQIEPSAYSSIIPLFFGKMGIFTPGINFPCLSLLSSIIKSIWSFTPKKFKAVVAFAGDPYPIIFFPLDFRFLIFFLTFF